MVKPLMFINFKTPFGVAFSAPSSLLIASTKLSWSSDVHCNRGLLEARAPDVGDLTEDDPRLSVGEVI